MFLVTPVFWILIAFILAGLECEIEGPFGWASRLPTCRIENRWLVPALRPFFGGRPITLYHCFMFSLVTLICHVGYVQGVRMTWMNECKFLSTLFLLCPTWDFLWFVLNPNYGLKKFRREHVEWHRHRRWILGLFPIDYAIAFILSLAFSALSWLSQDAVIFDVIFGATGYFFWMCLLGLAVECGAPYRLWRSKKKPACDMRIPAAPPASGWIDSP